MQICCAQGSRTQIQEPRPTKPRMGGAAQAMLGHAGWASGTEEHFAGRAVFELGSWFVSFVGVISGSERSWKTYTILRILSATVDIHTIVLHSYLLLGVP